MLASKDLLYENEMEEYLFMHSMSPLIPLVGERNILESLLGTVEQHVSVQGVSYDCLVTF